MNAHCYDLSAFLSCIAYVGYYTRTVNIVDLDVASFSNAVRAVSVVEKRDFKPIDVMNHRQYGIAMSEVAIYADIRGSFSFQCVYSSYHAFVASVKNVVVGGQDKIEAGIPERVDIVVMRTKHRVA